MPAFSGQLRANLVFAAIYNMIISQQVFADNIRHHQDLVDKARVDGTLYGDTKLYYSTDVLKTRAWGGDSEASNLLAINRPKEPEVQAIALDVFRQIDITVDDYLTKQAWMDEGSFSDFNSVMLAWLDTTRRVYDGTTYNVFIGTSVTSTGGQLRSLPLSTITTGLTGEEKARVEAQAIANDLANLVVEMEDYSRKFNDYGQMRSHADGDLIVVWNSKYMNQITNLDLPTIFNKDSLNFKFSQDYLPGRYWGTIITATNISTYSASTPAAGKPIDSDDGTYTPGTNNANGTLRSAVEKDVTVSGVDYHLFPGDEIPAGATVKSTAGDFGYGEVYIERSDVLYKVFTKLPPYMSAFRVGTSFFNPRSLTTNHYLTFGHNTIEYLKGKPNITVVAS